MSSNQRNNKAEIDRYRKELRQMLGDISGIDKKVLNSAVNVGLAYAKGNTPEATGFMKKSWSTTPIVKTAKGVQKSLMNSANYASFVNDGHRLVNMAGETTGFVEGKFILERAISRVNKAMKSEFEKEVKRIDGKYSK